MQKILIDDEYFTVVYNETIDPDNGVVKEWGLSIHSNHQDIIKRLNELYETEKQYKALKESINSKS